MPIQTGRVVSYAGSALINGQTKQNVIRGPHFDTMYELSNIFKFDLEVKEKYGIAKFHQGLLTGDIDLEFLEHLGHQFLLFLLLCPRVRRCLELLDYHLRH